MWFYVYWMTAQEAEWRGSSQVEGSWYFFQPRTDWRPNISDLHLNEPCWMFWSLPTKFQMSHRSTTLHLESFYQNQNQKQLFRCVLLITVACPMIRRADVCWGRWHVLGMTHRVSHPSFPPTAHLLPYSSFQGRRAVGRRCYKWHANHGAATDCWIYFSATEPNSGTASARTV